MQNGPVDVNHEIISELIKERRSEKRWKNIRFFLMFFIIATLFTAVIVGKKNAATVGVGEDKGYVALVRLEGIIESGRDFSAATVLPILQDAFSDTHAKGVVLDINSGGGTPVQASIIHDAVLELKKTYDKKVIVVGEDLLASGAYYVAVSGDKIYVNPNTITGSIGVIMKGFGLPDLIKKLGIERRVYTAGVNKDRLDPFLPQNKEDIEKIQTVIAEVHNNFKNIVLEGRKGKLAGNSNELFSGDFWSGETALKLGLVDGLGNLTSVIKKEFDVSHYKDYSVGENVLKNIVGQLGTSVDAAINNREELKLFAKI